MSKTFRSFALPHFRWYALAALIANTAMWMQRIDQDWLAVKITHHGAAVGVTTALQFLPTLLVGPFAGELADRMAKRRLLILSCATMAAPAFLLGLFIATHSATVWHIYGCALLLGVASAVDAPVRAAFIREIMGKEHLVNAIGLNQVNFHTSRIIGPAIAGFMISATGIATAFFTVGTFFAASAAMLFKIKSAGLNPDDDDGAAPIPAGLGGALRQLAAQPGLLATIALAAAVSSFALNFQVTLTLMATQVFKLQAAGFGGLTSMMAVGSITGALLTARMEAPSYFRVLGCATMLGLIYLVAVLAGGAGQFGLILVPIGLTSNMFLSSSSAVVQLRVDPRLQGRITGLYMAGTNALVPLGAVVIGLAADRWTPRAPLGVAGAVCVIGGLTTLAVLLGLKVIRWDGGWLKDVDPIRVRPQDQPIPVVPAPAVAAPDRLQP